MDLGNMPMQTEQNGMPATGQASNQQPAQGSRANMFGQDVYMGADTKTGSGEGYSLGFMLPKQSD
jgi:hypothetical protein